MVLNLYQPAQRHLVQFNAGKCIREGNLVKPDLRKGMIYMDQGEDQLMHFYWKERNSSEPEDNLIIFPDEAELVHVPECTTGRVIVLKFKTSSERWFYWMQHKKDDEDEELIKRVNTLIDNPSSAMDDGAMDIDPQNIEMELMQRLMGSASDGSLTEESLMELFSQARGHASRGQEEATETDDNTTTATVAPSVTDTVTTVADVTAQTPEKSQEAAVSTADTPKQSEQGASSAVSAEQYQQLQSILDSMQQQQQGRSSVQLNDVLNTQVLSALLDDPAVCSSLYPHLPDQTEHTPAQLRQVVLSPQFQQALHGFTSALQSGQLGPLIQQFGLDASSGLSPEAFLRGIEHKVRENQQNASSNKDEDHMDES
ncbi:adhesion regulating molecule [Hesseltinella vesiculosa]|uniref:Adhesion regulating molecule n=1 Tax=Hesseltinella vesiculosa TaxID=101127 RepID=A0A1X2GAH2_9FUNG|nr:adhesion regulating molecule [Hesseltinella vesiculosa]